MKATGIVRRIDDLGRVVIPKEIRRTMRIREGDPLEIYTDKDGGVIFKKYSLMGGLAEFAGQLCETLNRTTGRIAVICDRDNCIAVAMILAILDEDDPDQFHNTSAYDDDLEMMSQPYDDSGYQHADVEMDDVPGQERPSRIG